MIPKQWIVVIFAVAALLLAESVYYLVMYLEGRDRTELHRRLRSLSAPGAPGLLKDRRLSRFSALDRLLRSMPVVARLDRLLVETDLTLTAATVLGLSFALSVGGALAAHRIFRGSAAMAVVGAGVGALLPLVHVLGARTRRNKRISAQLPDALETMVRSLRAGHGIVSGFRLVAEEMPVPIAIEFGRCFEEQNLGVDFRDAVQRMAERVPGNLDLKIFAVSVAIQRETGGNLVENLEQIASTIRERFKFYGKLRALTAEGKLSGMILGSLPLVSGLIVGILNPTYLQPLLTDPLGRVFLGGGAALWAFGIAWMTKIARVEY